MKLKDILTNATVIVPIFRGIKSIIDCIRIIRNFNETSQEVIEARDEIVNQMKSIKEILEELNNFGKVNR